MEGGRPKSLAGGNAAVLLDYGAILVVVLPDSRDDRGIMNLSSSVLIARELFRVSHLGEGPHPASRQGKRIEKNTKLYLDGPSGAGASGLVRPCSKVEVKSGAMPAVRNPRGKASGAVKPETLPRRRCPGIRVYEGLEESSFSSRDLQRRPAAPLPPRAFLASACH